jgi:hypothetical protein
LWDHQLAAKFKIQTHQTNQTKINYGISTDNGYIGKDANLGATEQAQMRKKAYR